MKKLDFVQMETLRGGVSEMGANTGITEIEDYQINWCHVGRGVSGMGFGLMLVGATLSGGVATAAFAAIVTATTIYC